MYLCFRVSLYIDFVAVTVTASQPAPQACRDRGWSTTEAENVYGGVLGTRSLKLAACTWSRAAAAAFRISLFPWTTGRIESPSPGAASPLPRVAARGFLLPRSRACLAYRGVPGGRAFRFDCTVWPSCKPRRAASSAVLGSISAAQFVKPDSTHIIQVTSEVRCGHSCLRVDATDVPMSTSG